MITCSPTALRRDALGEFARVYKAEHRVEECLKRAKSEAGLGGYQVRTWEGWHHHQALSLLATWFLSEEARRGKNTDARGGRFHCDAVELIAWACCGASC